MSWNRFEVSASETFGRRFWRTGPSRHLGEAAVFHRPKCLPSVLNHLFEHFERRLDVAAPGLEAFSDGEAGHDQGGD